MRILDNVGLVQDPFHQGADILDKLLNDLKSKVPFLKKKVDEDEEIEDLSDESTDPGIDTSDRTRVGKIKEISEDEEEESDVDEDKSLVNKLKKKIAALSKKKSQSDDEEIDEEDEEDSSKKPKKSNSKIIIICSVIIMGVILLPDMFEPEKVVTPVLKPRKRPNKKVVPKDSEVKVPVEGAEPKTETAATPSMETPATETPSAETPSIETPTTETPPDVATTPSESVEATPSSTETPTTETTEPTVTETVPADSSTTTTISGEDSPVDVTSTDATPSTPSTIIDNSSPDTIDGIDTPKSDENLTDQILKDLENQTKNSTSENAGVKEYVSPPDYDYRGRGLVYNCLGKHWACIDGPSYKKCEDNASGNKYLKKSTECYPFNVYESAVDCTKMQNRVVSSSAKTNFCQGD